MSDRDELRRLIDVIEKSSGTGSVEQAVDDIKDLCQYRKLLGQQVRYASEVRQGQGEEKAQVQNGRRDSFNAYSKTSGTQISNNAPCPDVIQ